MNTVNWIGCIALLVGYFLLTTKKPTLNQRMAGIIVTFIGQFLVWLWAMSIKAWPVVTLEVVFIVVSVVQAVRLNEELKRGS